MNERTFTVAHVSLHRRPPARDGRGLLAAWWSLRDVAEAVTTAGLSCVVFQPFWKDEVLELDGVTYRFVAERRRVQALAARPTRLLSALASTLPAVIHVHGIAHPLQLAWVTRAGLKAPIVVQDHASSAPRGASRLAWQWIFKRVAGVAFTAREQAAPFVNRGVFRRDLPLFEIPEATSRFTPGDREVARRTTGVYGDPCLVWLGNLDENKDPLTVLDALSRATSALPDPHLWCCFRAAPLLREVQRRIEDDPVLASRVHLLGPRSHDQIAELLRAADFFLQGSHREGSGYALIEALACGTPAIVTDIPAFRRLTGNGAVGALSTPGDPAAMAAALVHWSQRDREALRQAVRAHFAAALSPEAVGAAWRSAYETLLSRPSPASC